MNNRSVPVQKSYFEVSWSSGGTIVSACSPEEAIRITSKDHGIPSGNLSAIIHGDEGKFIVN